MLEDLKIYHSIRRLTHIGSDEKHLLCDYLQHEEAGIEFMPTDKVLAERLGVTPNRIQRVIAKLKTKNIIKTQQVRRQTDDSFYSARKVTINHENLK